MTTIYDNHENNIINPMTELLRWIGLYHLVWVFNNEDIGIDLFQELTIRDLNDIGVTNVKVVKCVKQSEYLNRLYTALDNTTDPELLKFLCQEIRSIHIQRGTW